MHRNHNPPTAIAFGLIVASLVAACAPGGGSKTPPGSHAPTPTPIASSVASLEEAARIVIASDPRFANVRKLDPNLIGASAWWEGRTIATGFEIKVTLGWGDCPAGCINKHVWTIDVTPDGTLTLVAESGDPLPPGSLPI